MAQGTSPRETLRAKLGIKPGMHVWSVGVPADIDTLLPHSANQPPAADVIVAFVAERREVAATLASVLPAYRRGARLWFAYPKKSGGIRSDLSRDEVWDVFGDAELLAVTQIAIDANWSALRFRYRDEIPRLTRKQDGPGA